MTNNFSIFYPNPQDVEFRLNEADWGYINDRNADFAYANVTVIPLLFEFVVQQQRVPSAVDCARHLWQYKVKGIATDRDAELARKRTKKLVQDFFRELHTFGMLAQSTLFGTVRYAKAEDIDLGIDYTAFLSLMYAAAVDSVGIQSAMRANWTTDLFTQLKDKRRHGRNGFAQWDGPIYWITNKYRKPTSIGGVWLFTQAHVQDLIDEVTGNKEDGDIAIRLPAEGL